MPNPDLSLENELLVQCTVHTSTTKTEKLQNTINTKTDYRTVIHIVKVSQCGATSFIIQFLLLNHYRQGWEFTLRFVVRIACFLRAKVRIALVHFFLKELLERIVLVTRFKRATGANGIL